MKVREITAKKAIRAGTEDMKMLNVIPVAAVVLSCTMISFSISSVEGAPGMGSGGGGGSVAGFSGGGGRGGGGGGGVASRGAAMASRGGFGGSQGALAGSRAAVTGGRAGAFVGNRAINAVPANQNATFRGRGSSNANRAAFTGNNVTNNAAANIAGTPVRRAGSVSFRAAGAAAAGVSAVGVPSLGPGAQGSIAARADSVGAVENITNAQAALEAQAFNNGFAQQQAVGQSDWRRNGGDFGRRGQVRRAIPLYYYGFNFYPSYGFNINDFSPVTVDSNGRPFDRRFVRSNEAVRVPGAILPVAGAPRTVDVQLALRSRGFYGGPIDGVIGSQSRGAIRAFQFANGLPVNGVIDSRMFTVLMRGF